MARRRTKMVKERLKEVPQEDLKRFFIPKEDPEKINEESISFLYAENIEPPTTLIVSKKENRVVGGSYTSKPIKDKKYRSYLQVKTQEVSQTLSSLRWSLKPSLSPSVRNLPKEEK